MTNGATETARELPPQPSTKSKSLFEYWLPAALLLAVFSFTIPGGSSADLWWHLSTGQYIVQHKTVPHADPFSATAAGKPWIAHEWLSDVILYLTYSWAGSIGLLLLVAALITLAFWITYRQCHGPEVANVLAIALGVWTAFPTFMARPQVFTVLLAAIFLLILCKYRDGRSGRELLVLPLLTLLWVNLHGGYILGPALVLLALVGCLIDGAAHLQDAATTRRQMRELALAFLGCMVVVPLNPNGLKMYSYPLETLHSSAMQARIMEWHSPDFHMSIFYPLALLLFLAVAVFSLSPKRPRPSEMLRFAVFGLATLRSMRNLPIFVLVTVPLLAQYCVLPKWHWPQLQPNLRRTLQVVALLLVAAFSAQYLSNRLADDIRIERARFPFGAVKYIQENQPPGPIFNSYDFGGFLIWKLYPHYRVFIDGRADLYGDEFIEDFVRVYEVQVDPGPRLDQSGIRTVIVEPGSNIASFLRTQSQWRRVYEDQLGVIFTR